MDAVAAPTPPAQSSALSSQASPNNNTASQSFPRNIVTAAQDSLERAIAATSPRNIVTAAQDSLERAIAATSPRNIVTAAQDSLERAIAATSPRNIVTAAQDSLERAIAATSPRNIVTAAQDSLERAIAATSPRNIVTAAQDSLGWANAVSPQTSPRKFVEQKSLEEAIGVSNHIYKALEPTETAHVMLSQTSTSLPQPLFSQPRNIEVTAQDSTNITFAQVTATQQPLNKTIVTTEGTWQNVAAPALPYNTLPAVQDFLQMTFETVQQSKQTAMTEDTNTLQSATNQPTPIATAMVQHPLPPMFVATPLSPQTPLPAQYQTLQKEATSQPHTIRDASKPLTTSLPHKDIFNIKQTMTKSTEASTSLEQIPSTSEIKKTSTSQIETNCKSQSYPEYTFYNTTHQNNPKQMLSSKRSVLVAKRHNVVDKTEPETGISSQETTSKMLSQPTSKAQNLRAPQKKNFGQGPQYSPGKQNSSRVAQSFNEYRQRGVNSPQTSQSFKGPQNAHSDAGGTNHNWRCLAGGSKAIDDGVEQIDPKRKVLVSGFPAYTHSQDLTRVLSRFGNCKVDSCRNRLAVVTFDSEAEAMSAIKASFDVNIYGEFVEIKTYTNPTHVDELYRAYRKVISTQKGQDITMPDKIDLKGDFIHQLENIQNAIRLTREQVQAITNLYVDLERVLQKEWPGCVAIPFGSIPTGLGIKSSDADCYVELPAALRPRGSAGGAAAFVTRARRLLHYYPNVFTHLVAIPRANTPIVKFRHVPSGFHCDVSAKTPLGAQNSKLIKLLLEHDPRLTHIAVLIKYWAKVHDLSGTGRLTNYALTMMVIFYFQQPAVGLVPPVERLQRDPSSWYIVDCWNAGFSSRIQPGAPNSVTLPDLLGGFFEFYANFDFENVVVCPYLGTAVLKTAFQSPDTLPSEFARYVANVRDNIASPIRHTTPFCVQDPFEQSHNVASSVSAKLANDIREFLKFAADTYAADRANDCRNFLRTILLTRPKLRSDRVIPTTSMILIPRVRGHIPDPDWRATVRKIIIDMIFEKILKLQLKRDDKVKKKERGHRPGKFEKERYSGSTLKPVWRRRKGHAIHISLLEEPEEFVARQAALTDGILAGPLVAPLEFALELWFRDEPRALNLTFKMTNGDMDAFRHAVTFLHTVMFEWFNVLLRPHLAPLTEDMRQALLADAAERSAGQVECIIKFKREAPRPASPPRLVLDPAVVTPRLSLDPADINRVFCAVTLDSDSESSDDSAKEPR